MRYLSVCSGIEAATVAWHELGWQPVGFSEIEPFPSAVLAHHYPNVTNFGDMTKYKEWNIGTERLDLLVGGTPCQSFSVAGLRKGMDDPRGNLALTYCGILDHFRPQWFVWENVPGVLSSSGGRDFGSFLGALAELGYGFAYRVLDAQFFGVAQRRRRVFVVGYLGDWRPPAAVLFERQSLRRDTTPSREKRKVTPTLSSSGTGVSRVEFNCEDEWFIEQPFNVANCLTQRMHKGINTTVDEGQTPIISFENNRRDGARLYGDLTNTLQAFAGTGGGNGPMVAQPIPFDTTQITSPQNGCNPQPGAPCHPLAAGAHPPAIAQPISMRESGMGYWMEDTVAGTIDANMGMSGHANRPAVIKQQSMAVRRLTPVECERLQGFRDNYTNIPWRKKDESPDGPRYKALGNSMAVPVMNWIGKKIQKISLNPIDSPDS